MCGICGFTGEVVDRDLVINKMTEEITHRGPDSDGFFLDDYVTMGFRRLSIIDLEEGHQPIYNEDKSLVLTFNGEIYNYKQLREELKKKGHTFYTDTDSEVLVHGYEEWREDMLPRLRGMFGFAIYNTKDKNNGGVWGTEGYYAYYNASDAAKQKLPIAFIYAPYYTDQTEFEAMLTSMASRFPKTNMANAPQAYIMANPVIAYKFDA